ncbi:unnamed protein product [Caenorhabditis sp. 36 PRJEB53466]|nr:unnamed protein product [Caenorhabditis sp. 36 PRJEB53466]
MVKDNNNSGSGASMPPKWSMQRRGIFGPQLTSDDHELGIDLIFALDQKDVRSAGTAENMKSLLSAQALFRVLYKRVGEWNDDKEWKDSIGLLHTEASSTVTMIWFSPSRRSTTTASSKSKEL